MSGALVVDSVGGQVDGMSLLVDPGTYQFTLVSTGLSAEAGQECALCRQMLSGLSLAAPSPARWSRKTHLYRCRRGEFNQSPQRTRHGLYHCWLWLPQSDV